MSAATEKIGIRAIRVTHSILDTVVLLAIMLLITIGSYAIWDSNQVFSAASATRYEVYKPTAENAGKSFGELQALNPDVIAWLTVYGTHIDYPVTQGLNNIKYVNTNAEGKYSLSGSIFLDAGCARDFSDFSSILYGHHMEKQAMFGELGKFSERSYFSEHPYGMLYYDGEEHGLEFFAFVHADAYNTRVFRTRITGESDKQNYLNLLLGMAIHTRDIGVTTSDRIILLSTCSSASTNGRDILVGRITSKLYDDPFKPSVTDRAPGKTQSVDHDMGLWESTPLWARIIIIALPILLLIVLGSLLIRKKRRSHHRAARRD